MTNNLCLVPYLPPPNWIMKIFIHSFTLDFLLCTGNRNNRVIFNFLFHSHKKLICNIWGSVRLLKLPIMIWSWDIEYKKSNYFQYNLSSSLKHNYTENRIKIFETNILKCYQIVMSLRPLIHADCAICWWVIKMPCSWLPSVLMKVNWTEEGSGSRNGYTCKNGNG